MPVTCHSCNKVFPDYKSLAVHITKSKKGHQRGKKWAAGYDLFDVMYEKKQPERPRLTEQERENKADSRREISGINKTVVTKCPKCKGMSKQSLPVEYTNSQEAWRINKMLVVLCPICK